MKINKLNKILVVAMLVIVAAPACLMGERSPTPTPAPTPTPVAAQIFYDTITTIATQQPARLDGIIERGPAFNLEGTVTNTSIDNGKGVIEFHFRRIDIAPDSYVKCEMSNVQDAQSATRGSTIVVQGRLKDAFDDGERLRSVRPGGNNVIDLEKCTILRN